MKSKRRKKELEIRRLSDNIDASASKNLDQKFLEKE